MLEGRIKRVMRAWKRRLFAYSDFAIMLNRILSWTRRAESDQRERMRPVLASFVIASLLSGFTLVLLVYWLLLMEPIFYIRFPNLDR